MVENLLLRQQLQIALRVPFKKESAVRRRGCTHESGRPSDRAG